MEEHVCSLYNLFSQFAVAQVCHVFLSILKYIDHAFGVTRRSTLFPMIAACWSSVRPTADNVSSTRCRDAMGIIGQSLPFSTCSTPSNSMAKRIDAGSYPIVSTYRRLRASPGGPPCQPSR